jgi:hypothetical protein
MGRDLDLPYSLSLLLLILLFLIGLVDASCSGEDSDERPEDTGTGTLTPVDNAADVSRRAAADLGRDSGSGEEQSPRRRAGEIGYEYVWGGGGGTRVDFQNVLCQ